jgi:hypothetical protein
MALGWLLPPGAEGPLGKSAPACCLQSLRGAKPELLYVAVRAKKAKKGVDILLKTGLMVSN